MVDEEEEEEDGPDPWGELGGEVAAAAGPS